MKKYYMNGVLVPKGDKWIYDLFGIQATTFEQLRDFLEEANGEEVTVYIDSPGGLITVGSNIYDALREYGGQSTAHVTAWAASAASWAMLGADKVVAAPTARFMLHNATGMAEGDYRDMEAAVGRLKNANNSFINAYQLKTGKSRAEIQAIMDKETFYVAQEALDNGFIDEIALKEGEELEPLIAAAMPMGGVNIQKMHELAMKYKDDPDKLIEKAKAEQGEAKPGGNGAEGAKDDAESGGKCRPVSDRNEQIPDALITQRQEFNRLRKRLYN
jgi:ATP-dependent Clp endopeptidase proteolytic subunit ClpP